MARRLRVLAAGAVLAACAAGAPPDEPGAVRLLPAEPAASLLYVSLGDSTVEGVGASSPSCACGSCGVQGWGRDGLGTGARGRGARARRALMSTRR